MLYLRNHVHADRDSARTAYFIDINVAKGCKVTVDWVIADLLNPAPKADWLQPYAVEDVHVGAGVDDAGLSPKFFQRARTALANEACDLVRDLVCNVHFVESFDRSCGQFGNSAADKRFGKARIPRQLLEILWRDLI
jgi:hypothetical protein